MSRISARVQVTAMGINLRMKGLAVFDVSKTELQAHIELLAIEALRICGYKNCSILPRNNLLSDDESFYSIDGKVYISSNVPMIRDISSLGLTFKDVTVEYHDYNNQFLKKIGG